MGTRDSRGSRGGIKGLYNHRKLKYLQSKMLVAWLLPLGLMVTITMPWLEAVGMNNNPMIIRTRTFSSPPFTMTPGLVIEKFFYNINFPTGHIAIKSFDVEVVDEAGNQVPVSETYLHHWSLLRYFQHKNALDPTISTPYAELHEPDFIIASNNGVCEREALPPYYAMGSESKTISTFLPDPYGIEVGNATEIPTEYEERWSLNVHAIDIKSAENKLGCIECRCHLYNITKDRFGRPLRPDYKGGFKCCYDKTQCRVSPNYGGYQERKLYLRYSVKWVDWNDLVIPVKVYLFDVTDTWKPLADPTRASKQHHCQYDIDAEDCSLTNKLEDDGKCNAVKNLKVRFPSSGYLIYGVAHQHIGAIGATFYGEDGRVLCSSSPIYGSGKEEGYVIGMTTCYPEPGSVKINNGEMVSFISNYDSTQNRTGVMGIFHILVAEKVISKSSSLPKEVAIGKTVVM